MNQAQNILDATNVYQIQSAMMETTKDLLSSLDGAENSLPQTVAYDLWNSRYAIARNFFMSTDPDDGFKSFVKLQCDLFEDTDFGVSSSMEFRQEQLRLDCEKIDGRGS
jgi:hypothetical protein